MTTTKRILVVEDEIPIQEFYQEIFGRLGYEVDMADDGRIGFRKGVTFDYDLIVCDLLMPNWHGVDTIKGILLVKPNSRFIVITGYADKKITDELKDVDAVIDVIAKPVKVETLRACLEMI